MKADQLDRRIKEIELELLRADPALGRQFAKLARVNRRHETTVFALLVSSAVFLTIGLATISVVAWLVGVVSLIASFSVDTRYEHQLRAIRRPSEFGHRPRNRHLRCSEQR